MWQIYHTPRSLDEAIERLAEYKGEAQIVAGGTDLIVEMRRGLRSPKVLVDITRISDMDRITLDEARHIHLGPLVTHNQVVGSELCMKMAFPLAKACWKVGAPQIRNRGTIAGNLATASPANDTLSPLWVLGASLTVRSVRGSRTLPLRDFIKGVRETSLKSDEMIVDIFFPSMTDTQKGTFLKLGLRRSLAVSVVNVAAMINMMGGTISEAHIALGSVGPKIIHAEKAEEFLKGKKLKRKVIAQAAKMAARVISPISDLRGSAEYRRYLAETLVRQALEALSKGTDPDNLPSRPIMLWGSTNGHFPLDADGNTVHSLAHGEPIVTTINGENKIIYGANDKTLLRMLREDVGLTGTKEGCAEGECGACTVLMDGIAVMSCLVPAPRAHGSQIVTIEGLSVGNALHPLQKAFMSEGAVQCGYCTPGFIMSGAALFEERERPTLDEMKQAITGNLCRCTGYYGILRALQKACGTR